MLSERTGAGLDRSAARDLRELAAYLRHDYVEPIRAIGLALELLEADGVGVAERETLSSYVREAATDLQVGAQRLAEFFMLTESSPATSRLIEVVDRANESTRATFPDRAVSIACPDVLVEADPNLLAVAFTELFSNLARFATTSAPTAEVDVDFASGLVIRLVEPPSSDPWTSRQDLVELMRHGPEGGPGVGLAICRRITELHGGRLSLVVDDGRPVVVIDLSRG